MVLVLWARCECRHPPRSRLYRSVGLKMGNLTYLVIRALLEIVPVKFIVVVDEHE